MHAFTEAIRKRLLVSVHSAWKESFHSPVAPSENVDSFLTHSARWGFSTESEAVRLVRNLARLGWTGVSSQPFPASAIAVLEDPDLLPPLKLSLLDMLEAPK